MQQNRFTYQKFVKNMLDTHAIALLPSGMSREAMAAGAPDRGEKLRKELRMACDGVASLKGYQRVKENGVTGYLYQRIQTPFHPLNNQPKRII